MKKFCYLLSIAGHALALLIVLNARFAITIRPEPPHKGTPALQPGQPREIVVSIAEPPLHPAGSPPIWAQRGGGTGSGASVSGQGSGSAAAISGKSESAAPRTGGLAFPAPSGLDLTPGTSGSFRLAPVGKSPEPWAVPVGPGRSPGLRNFSAGAYRPGAAPGGAAGPGGVFLLPFDIGERTVADWSQAVLSRIERNWTIPTSGRLAFSGRVQITLTIERQGSQRALVVDETSVPEPLTRAALHAVQASLPLPPIPENVAGESLAFTLIFSYNG